MQETKKQTPQKEPGGREMALELLLLILEQGEYSHRAVNKKLNEWAEVSKRERAFATRLCEGTIERCLEIDWILSRFSKTPVSKMKPVIRTILRMGVYELRYMTQVPASATCNEAVKATKKRGFAGLAGFVNGVLRAVARAEKLPYPDEKAEPLLALSVTYSVPEWLAEQMVKQYGFFTAKQIFAAYLAEDNTVTIRCNESRMKKADLKELLLKSNHSVNDAPYVEEAMRIADYDRIETLPGYKEGAFYVQDVSSMLAVRAAGLKKGDRVLDICAAPGGKALYAAELLTCLGGGTVEARDVSEGKVRLLQENIERSGYTNLTATCKDATEYDEESLETADVLLADLPCSGLGIIGKKPDIKYRMTPEKEKELADLQRRILRTAAGYVKRGGTLLYSTCTLNKEENEENFFWLCRELSFEPLSLEETLPEELHGETTKKGYLQLLPGICDCDGFFIARCKRL